MGKKSNENMKEKKDEKEGNEQEGRWMRTGLRIKQPRWSVYKLRVKCKISFAHAELLLLLKEDDVGL